MEPIEEKLQRALEARRQKVRRVIDEAIASGEIDEIRIDGYRKHIPDQILVELMQEGFNIMRRFDKHNKHPSIEVSLIGWYPGRQGICITFGEVEKREENNSSRSSNYDDDYDSYYEED